MLGPSGAEETWSYDGEGNCTRHVGANGEAATFEYTHFDLLAARTGPDQERHSFTYDAELRLIKVTNSRGLDWSFAYDDAGRLIGECDFDGSTVEYSRDALGRLTRRTNPLGQAVSFSYDVMGRTASKNVDGIVTDYTYDVVGQIEGAVSPSCDMTWQRDLTGRLLTETVNGRPLYLRRDALGRRTDRLTPAGARARYGYDTAGRRTSLRTSDRLIGFAYDAAGQEVERSVADSLSLKQDWDDAGRLQTMSLTSDNGPALRRSYSYRADNHLQGMNDSETGDWRYELDAVGRVTGVHARSWTESYAYDSNGEQTQADWPESEPGESARGPRVHSGGHLLRAGAVRYEYDRAGRMVQRRKTRLSHKADVWTYDWDAEDRLRTLVTPDGTTWRYQYDPFGRRITKQRLGANCVGVLEETLFTWDGPVLAEQSTTTKELPHQVTLTWDHAGTRPLVQAERLTNLSTQNEIDERFFSIVTDLVGSPTELVDESGNRAWYARKTLWGQTAWNTDSTTYSPLRFPGQYYDPESGLHYNCHRYYDPESGRYTTLDPLGLEPAPNPYGYVTNPGRYIDPLGLMSCDEDPWFCTMAAEIGPADQHSRWAPKADRTHLTPACT
ncbi:RHS repeat-associated core domain-containing protein [Streptomyces sp. A5-4]